MSSDSSSDDSQELKQDIFKRLTNSSVTKKPQNANVQQPQDDEQKKQDNISDGNKEEKQEEILQKNDEEQQDNVNNSQQQQEQQQSKSGSQSEIQQNNQNDENLQESQQEPVQSKWKQEALQQKMKKGSSSDNDTYSDSDSDNNKKKKSSLENLRNRLMNKDGDQNIEQEEKVDNNQKNENQQENQEKQQQQEEKQEKQQVFQFQIRSTDNNQQDQIKIREANDWNQELGHDVSEKQSYDQSGSHRYRSQRGRGQQQLGGQGRGFQKNPMGQQYSSNYNGGSRQQGQRFRQNYDRQSSRSMSRGSSQSPFKYGTNSERQQNIQSIGTHFRQQESYQNNQDGSQRQNVRQENYQNHQGGGLRGNRGISGREYYDSKGQQGYQNNYNKNNNYNNNYNNNDQYEVRNQNNNMRQNYNNNNQNGYQQQKVQATQQNQILDSDEDLNVQTKDTDIRQIKSDYIMKFNFQGVEIALVLGEIDVFQFKNSFLLNPIQKNTNNYSTYEQKLSKEISDYKEQIYNLFNDKSYFVNGVFNEYRLFNISTSPGSDLKFSYILNLISDNKLSTTIRLYKSALKHNAQKANFKSVCIPLLIADYQNQEFNNQEYIKQLFQEQINGLKELIIAQNINANQQYINFLERAWFVIQDYEHFEICGQIFYQHLVQSMKLSLSDKKQLK